MSTATSTEAMPAALRPLQQWAAGERLGGVTQVSQARIDAFADATGDHNWIHVDPVRARRSCRVAGPSPMASCCCH